VTRLLSAAYAAIKKVRTCTVFSN